MSEFLMNILSGLIASTLIFILLWFRNYIVEKMRIVYHFLITMFSRQRYVLIWNDDDIAYSVKISKILEKDFPSILFRSLHTPKEILNFPINSSIIQSIILIVSDVTKLSEDKNIKGKIQNWLVKYLGKGGGIIGTHDLIYRRVRNEKLEKAFGCQLTDFRRIEKKVKYIKNIAIKNHKMFNQLPDSFELDDGEICWGNWAHDVTSLFETEKEYSKPLVVVRKYLEGRVVWINSGDKKNYIAKSISLPEENFIILLRNAVDWISMKR